MVGEENAALITPPGDDAALGAVLARLGGDAALRARIGAANALRAAAEFDEGVMADRYAALYGAALGLARFP
jgi:glycosyltransferase involved in cell wall biosynthesis